MPSRVFMLYQGDNRIQAYSTKNRPVLGLSSSFGEPHHQIVAGRQANAAAVVEAVPAQYQSPSGFISSTDSVWGN